MEGKLFYYLTKVKEFNSFLVIICTVYHHESDKVSYSEQVTTRRFVRAKKMVQDFMEAEHLSSKDLIQFTGLI